MSAVVAFVSMFVEPIRLDDVLSALSRIDSVKEAYEVTGEFDIVSVVSVSDIEKFRDVLKNGIMKIAGVKSTVTSIILNPSKNRNPSH
jgi:DNA-binding Lrp family transcriptional regulator